jgi:hypothetical protein
MRGTLRVLLVVLGFGSCFSFAQTSTPASTPSRSPLDSYIDGLRKLQMNSVAAEFGGKCGVKLDEAMHRFSFANDDRGTWKIVANLPEAYDNIGMDLIDTAEVWENRAGTVIERWDVALDVGGFSRTLYCLNRAGRVTSLDCTNYQIPEDGKPWGVHLRWELGKSGGFRATIPLQFVGLDDQPISGPKLDEKHAHFVSVWGRKPPQLMTLSDLNLPTGLFR